MQGEFERVHEYYCSTGLYGCLPLRKTFLDVVVDLDIGNREGRCRTSDSVHETPGTW